MTRKTVGVMVQELESRFLMAAGAGLTDVQHVFHGTVALAEPLVIQSGPHRQTTVRRLAFTLNVTSETADGQIAGTMSLGRFGDATFTGTVAAKSLQINYSNAGGEQGTLVGTANAGGTRVNGQLDGIFNETQLIGRVHAVAPTSTTSTNGNTSPTGNGTGGAAPTVPPNLTTGVPAAASVGGNGVFQPGVNGLSPVTGLLIPSNGFAQPVVTTPTALAPASTTGAIVPTTGFIGAGATGTVAGMSFLF